MIIQISIDAGAIDAAMLATSKDEHRHYLKGVFLDARGFVVGTNGHMAFAARCEAIAGKLNDVRPAYGTSGIIVPSDAIAQAGKAAGRSKGLCYVFERDAQGLWWILYGNARIHFAPVDGSFPAWNRIIPTPPETLTAGHYNPLYLAALGNMAKALNDGKKDMGTAFRLHQAGENPALVTFRNLVGDARTDCVAVIMPMRTKSADYDAASTAHTRAFAL
jgi:hypothetical protein